jgi:hypothetical protein
VYTSGAGVGVSVGNAVGEELATMADVGSDVPVVGVEVSGSGSEPPPQTSRMVSTIAARMMMTISRPQARERIALDDLLIFL